MRPQRARGFSLIELMVVVLVLAIIGAIALPLLGNTHASKLRSAASLLAADLDHARVESMAHGDNPRLVVFDDDGGGYHVAAASAPDTPLDNPVGGMPYHTRFGLDRAHTLDGVQVLEVNGGGDRRVGFGMYGQLDQTDPVAVTLACGDRRVTLTLDPTSGEVTIGELQPR